tara:strand:- start:315 stop:1028 length:714 start_codon:yes stop_codon:yes gene_type:complete
MVDGQLFEDVLVIIPARKNSKGIINKNMLEVNGYPLIHYTFKFISNLGLTKNTIISTDSEKILKYATKFSLNNSLRPSNLSDDHSSIIDVVEYELNKIDYSEYKYILLLQPTAPLRKEKDLFEIYKKINLNDISEGIVSITKIDEPHPYKLKKILNNRILPFIDNTKSEVSRQLLPECFKLNGTFYLTKIKSFFKMKSFFSENTIPYIMKDSDSLNIDNYDDIILLNEKLKSYNHLK